MWVWESDNTAPTYHISPVALPPQSHYLLSSVPTSSPLPSPTFYSLTVNVHLLPTPPVCFTSPPTHLLIPHLLSLFIVFTPIISSLSPTCFLYASHPPTACSTSPPIHLLLPFPLLSVPLPLICIPPPSLPLPPLPSLPSASHASKVQQFCNFRPKNQWV